MSGSIQARLATALSDRYRIERELGAGGMATVYLARDLRHDRDVAIKVLHPDLAAALGGERFLSEIKTTAKLQHPHILPLLDSGSADALLFYVMPYVRGDTLRDRLQRETQLAVNDALRIANEVADALASAHDAGIIHRDIKPENILLQGEHALVADFGIALAVQEAGGARMTQTGLSLGTPQYMAPEQAMGDKTVDQRADVYALGAVTYEMLTGEPPHTGANAQAIVAKLLTEPVRPVRVLRPSVPEHVDGALNVALQKLPADRFATVREFADALRGGTNSRVMTPAPRASTARASRTPLRAAIALNVLLAVAIAVAMMRPATIAPTSRQQVVLWQTSIPTALVPGATFVGTQASISPDGETIVFTDSTDGWMLHRKRRNASTIEPMQGTEGAVSSCFSPDGRWVAFITVDGRIKKVPVDGGQPIVVADDGGSEYKSIAWTADGSLVYVTRGFDLVRVPSSGSGAPRKLRQPPNITGTIPTLNALPDNRGLLMSVCGGNCAFTTDVFVYDFDADTARLLIPRAVGGWYSPTGHLLFTSRDGGLFATTFDIDQLTAGSQHTPVVDGVAPGHFAISTSGSILYALDPNATQRAELVWVSRSGRTEPFDTTWRARFEYPAISPDGKSLAVSTTERTTDLWIRRTDGSRRKVISPLSGSWRPAWFPDGRAITFIGLGDLYANAQDATVWRVGSDASSAATQILRHRFGVYEAEVTPDTQWLVFRTDETIGGANIYTRRLHGDTTWVPLAANDGNDIQLALSPDGKRMAYTSAEGGVQQIFVASFPDMKTKRLVSRARGYEARWARSGKELFFESGGQLMSAAIGAGADLTVAEPRALFSLVGYRRARNRAQYDVAPGDQRFIMIKEPPRPPVPPVVYVENWLPELLAKVRK